MTLNFRQEQTGHLLLYKKNGTYRYKQLDGGPKLAVSLHNYIRYGNTTVDVFVLRPRIYPIYNSTEDVSYIGFILADEVNCDGRFTRKLFDKTLGTQRAEPLIRLIPFFKRSLSVEFLEASKDNWWDSDKMMKQLYDVIVLRKLLYPWANVIWPFDHSSNHRAQAPDALNVNSMNMRPGGKTKKYARWMLLGQSEE